MYELLIVVYFQGVNFGISREMGPGVPFDADEIMLTSALLHGQRYREPLKGFSFHHHFIIQYAHLLDLRPI